MTDLQLNQMIKKLDVPCVLVGSQCISRPNPDHARMISSVRPQPQRRIKYFQLTHQHAALRYQLKRSCVLSGQRRSTIPLDAGNTKTMLQPLRQVLKMLIKTPDGPRRLTAEPLMVEPTQAIASGCLCLVGHLVKIPRPA
ncbi:MAG: hypothetical protein AAF333_09785 [Planctomycetota bacterium]